MRPSAFFVSTLLLSASIVDPLKGAQTANSSVASQIQQAVSDLNQYRLIQQQAGIQDPNIAYAMRKAIVVADLILDPTGNLNLSLVPVLKSSFIPVKPLEYEATMGRVLDQLDLSWQLLFNSISAPKSSNALSNLIIRSLLSLKASDTISDRDAKLAVLASMLAPFNQGPVGDCFAVADLVRDHDEYYQHTAKDLASVIQSGNLTRAVGAANDYFFFLPTLADNDVITPFTLDNTGQIGATGITFLNAPGFIAAVNIMGGAQVPNLGSQTLSILFSKASSNQIQVTATQVIKAIAQVISKSNAQTLASNGLYAFSSLSNNPVLKSVECAFAAMAEDRSTDSTRGNINACISQAMGPAWAGVAGMANSENFKTAFYANFNGSYRLIYNPNIPLAQVSADGSSTDGGFQLYKRDPVATNLGTRMATPQDLRQLVLDAIDTTKNQISGSSKIASQLVKFVSNNSFLKNALWDYDPSNKQEPNPVGNYQKLSRSPMQSCDGDNPFEVDDIDTGKTFDPNVQNYTPSNSNDLITWCLNLAKKIPPGLVPMDSPQHAFNFAPGNADLAAYVKNGTNPATWIRQNIVIPGMKVSGHPIDSTTRSAVTNAMYNMIANAVPNSSTYQSMVANLGSNLTVQQFAQGLVNGVNTLLNSDSNQANQVAIVTDAILLQALPAADQNTLQTGAIRFAFTNWNDGPKDIYFCAFFNPRTQKVAFGTIDEDKTKLQPMDEVAWVNSQQWDIDLTPFAPSVSKK